jgi:beta-galactosidase
MVSDKIINKNWRFIKKDVKDAYLPEFNDKAWTEIDLPHTWNALDVQDGGGKRNIFFKKSDPGYYRGVGWYRTSLFLPSNIDQYRAFIRFEAAGSVADVYFNGNKLGQHLGAFSAFCYEITPYLNRNAENILAVKVDNSWRVDLPPLSGDFPVMGGLYRPVHLIIKAKTCITPLDYASPGVYIKQEKVSKLKADIELRTKISNMDQNVKEIALNYTILDAEGEKIKQSTKSLEIGFNNIIDVVQHISIENPHLWNGRDDPYLYTAKFELIKNNEVIDYMDQPLGLRYYHVDAESGFYLNGKPYAIRGVNRHQDRLNKGWALSYEDQNEDLQIIMEMGANAVRLAHYQHSDYFYQICDKKGILVWAELCIVDRVNFSKAFFENSRNMLIELIRQNYNHPSIFTWSLANELGIFQFRNPIKIIKKLNQIAHNEDSKRPTTIAGIFAAFFRKKLHRITDLIGWNYYPGWYYNSAKNMGPRLIKLNKVGNNRGCCVSEYGAGASIFQHQQNLTEKDKIKPYGKFHPEEKQNIVHEENYKQMVALPFVWGSFIWNMFDFAVSFRDEGDTPGRNDKGVVTYDRKVKKDVYYFYKANWTKEAMIYITSRRHKERNVPFTEIKIYSNCAEIEMLLNEKSLGKAPKEDFCISRFPKIELKKGLNKVEAIGKLNDQVVSDSINWYLK